MIEELVNEFAAKCDYIDARVCEVSNETVFLENGESSNIFVNNKSFGVRILYKGGWGLSYSFDFKNARSVFEKVLKIAKMSASNKKIEFNPPKKAIDDKSIDFEINPFNIEPIDKIKLLNEYDSLLKKDSKVKNTTLITQSIKEDREVYAPNINVHQEFMNNVFRSFVTAREGNVIQNVSKHYSRLGGFERIKSLSINDITNELLERVNRLLHAKPAKPERTTVVCDPLMTGLFFHEAVGHGCEADAVINKSSVFNGLMNKKVGSEEINLLDDPTIEERGFYWYDDEGVKARPTQLIKNGVLTGLLQSLKTANEMKTEPTGNGRSMDADTPPIPRMSNTTLKPGKWSFNDLIKEAGNGYLVKGFGGGVVDPITGQFSFGASECFRIINGEVGEPLRDVSLAGNILDVLKKIKVGNKQSKSFLTGTCGKQGQNVRVGDYCPSILVGGVIIGGTA